MHLVRAIIKITGTVQGVGFRPFIYSLAKSMSLNGWVCNSGGYVTIEIEGSKSQIIQFLNKIKSNRPMLCEIKKIDLKQVSYIGYKKFEIKKSSQYGMETIYISPDVSICNQCEKELFDKANKRFEHPFINCTDCGPRFSIIKNIPYDRKATTMASFAMCPECQKEYLDQSNRRYHAEPIACNNCGPKLSLLDSTRNKICTNNIIDYTKKLILEDKIIAIKSIGGYHLCCNATSFYAVNKLRRLKKRDYKPFAVMTLDIKKAQKLCHINDTEIHLLNSKEKPIVLLKKRENFLLPEAIAPDNSFLGIMLCYTPLHLLLLNDTGNNNIDYLVMTSGNTSDEPICFKDDNAILKLNNIADYFLINDREIHTRADDSVTREFNKKEFIIRRSRGYVPNPIVCEIFDKELDSSILACGGELKNTFCISRGNEFFLSHHIGDLKNSETLESFIGSIEHFENILNISPNTIAYDLHPQYLSSKHALSLNIERKIAIQHHHAHIAACMAENHAREKVIGVAFDGTGYGNDGNIWGGEFLIADYTSYKRMGHIEYHKMPGADTASHEPWRMAISYVNALDDNDAKHYLFNKSNISEGIDSLKINVVNEMLKKNMNCPLTSSVGRLFDGVASLIGLSLINLYEGQAATELEHICKNSYCGEYCFNIYEGASSFKIVLKDLILGILSDLQNKTERSIISSRFHETMANIIVESCKKIRANTGINHIALSGGVFQNITLLERAYKKLLDSGFTVYTHSRIPTNDGGLALGQAVVGLSQLKN